MVTRNPDNATLRWLSAEEPAEIIAERLYRGTREGRPAVAALVQRILDAIPDQLLAGADPKTAFEADGLLDELKKALVGNYPGGVGTARFGRGARVGSPPPCRMADWLIPCRDEP